MMDHPVNIPPLWTSLVQYYRSCLAREQELSVRVPAGAVILPEIEEHLISRRATTTILADPRQTRPVLAYLNSRGRGISGTFIYGYPLVRHGDSLLPLFYTEVRLEPGSAPQTILLTRGNAELLVNRHFLLEGAGLTDEEASGLLRDLRSPRSKRIDELLDAYLLEVDVRYDAVLFAADGAPAIRGPGRELQLMEHLRKERLPDTIRTFIGEQGIPSARPVPEPITILPADPSQAAALARLQAPFLVVTGPAGSGKTHTAINLIAGAAALGQRVLYISRDEEAVERAFQALTPSFPGVLRVGSRQVRAGAMAYARQVIRSVREFLYPADDLAELAGESHRLGEELARLDAEGQAAVHLDRLLAELALREEQVAAALAHHPLRSYIEALAGQVTPATAAQFQPEQLVAIRRLIARAAGWETDSGSLGGRLRELVRINQIKGCLKQAGLPEFCHPDGDLQELIAGLKRLEQALPLLLARARRLHAEGEKANHRPLPEIRAALEEASQAKAGVDRRRLHAAWLAVADRVRPRCDELEALIDQEERALTAEGQRARRRGRLGELLDAFPVVLSSTFAVSGIIPNEPELFDLLIVDDGSQVDIPSFLPVLYRAKRLCVLGDEEGPKHRTWLGAEEDSRLLDLVQGRNLAAFAYVETSVLDRAIQVVGQDHVVRLSRRYQSDQGTLRLEDVPEGETIYPAEEAISQAQNPLEAKRVVQLVTQQLARGITDLAILTPFRGQALLIQTLLARLAEIEPNPDRAAALRQVTVAYGDPAGLRKHRMVLLSLVAARGATPETLRWLERRRTDLHRMIAAASGQAILVGHRATLEGAGGALAALVAQAGGTVASPSGPAPVPPGLQPERLGLLEGERPLLREWLTLPSLAAEAFSDAERELHDLLAELLQGRPALLAPRLSLASVLEPAALASLAPADQAAAVEALLLFTLVDSRTLQPIAAVELQDGDPEMLQVKEAACRQARLPLVRLRPGQWQPLRSLLSLVPRN